MRLVVVRTPVVARDIEAQIARRRPSASRTSSPASMTSGPIPSAGIAAIAYLRTGLPGQRENAGKAACLFLKSVDRFDLQVLFKPEFAHRAPDAGLLVAAHGCQRVGRRAVEANPSRAQTAGEFIALLAVAAEDVAAEAVGTVIGDLEAPLPRWSRG